MKRLSLLLALALAACKPDRTAADGYIFETPVEKLNQRTITVVVHQSREELIRSHPKIKDKESAEKSLIQAYAIYTPKGDRCWIHIVDPAKHYQPEFYGHELTHCLYGRWHPSR